MLAYKSVHAGEEHSPARVRVVPAHHVGTFGKQIPFPRNVAPGFVSELETTLGRFVMLGSQAVGDDNEFVSVFVFIMSAQQHTSKFDVGIGECVSFHFARHVYVNVYR